MSQATSRLNALFGGVMLLVIFVAVNALAARYNARWDFTTDKEYTLAEGLRRILTRLADGDEVVQIVAYVTNDVPGHAIAARDRVIDLMNDIDATSGGSVEVTFIDPQDSDALAQQAAEYGISPIQMIATDKGSSTVANIYCGVVIKRQGVFESVPQLLNQGRTGIILHPEAEYQLSAALVKVSSDDKKTIGFLQGHGEPSLGPEEQGVHAAVLKVYGVDIVDTTTTSSVPDAVDLLVVRAPAQLDDRDRYAIDQFVMSGKPVLFLTPRNTITDEGRLASTDAVLLDMLIGYGAEIGSELVVDQMGYGLGIKFVGADGQAMYQAVVSPKGDKESPITSRLEGLQAALAGTVIPSSSLGERTFTKLVGLTDTTMKVRGLQDLDLGRGSTQVLPTATVQPVASDAALLAVVKGPMMSFFKGKDIPQQRPPKQGSATPVEPEGSFLEQTPAEGGTILVGSFDFLMFNQLIRSRANVQLVLNAFDHLLLSEDLISVRSRTVESRPLELLSEAEEEKIEGAVIARYKDIDADFTLYPNLSELRSYDEEKVKRVRKARIEISDALDEAVRSQRYWFYTLNFAFMPVLLCCGGLLRFAWRRRVSKRVFSAAAS